MNRRGWLGSVAALGLGWLASKLPTPKEPEPKVASGYARWGNHHVEHPMVLTTTNGNNTTGTAYWYYVRHWRP